MLHTIFQCMYMYITCTYTFINCKPVYTCLYSVQRLTYNFVQLCPGGQDSRCAFISPGPSSGSPGARMPRLPPPTIPFKFTINALLGYPPPMTVTRSLSLPVACG